NQLAKRDAIAPAMAREYRVQALVQLLAEAASDRGALARRWHSLSAREQAETRVAAATARHATELGDALLAREAVEHALAEEWAPALVSLYAAIPAGLPPAARSAEALVRIERAERWLLERERDAQLLGALGRLCAQAELWGKARSFLEASLSFEETRAAASPPVPRARPGWRREKPWQAAGAPGEARARRRTRRSCTGRLPSRAKARPRTRCRSRDARTRRGPARGWGAC